MTATDQLLWPGLNRVVRLLEEVQDLVDEGDAFCRVSLGCETSDGCLGDVPGEDDQLLSRVDELELGFQPPVAGQVGGQSRSKQRLVEPLVHTCLLRSVRLGVWQKTPTARSLAGG